MTNRRLLLSSVLLGAGLAGRMTLRSARSTDLHGQAALITGGSRGLGLLLAREFAREGCRLVICARDVTELEVARADLTASGAEVLAIPCDIADRGQVEHLVAAATRRYGAIDILIANAGIMEVGPLATMELADFERALGVMFWGVLNPILAVLPQMRARRSGRIVAITSIGGKVSVPHLLPYGAAKFAAVGLAEGLRAELAGTGVRVTTVVPGLMRTGSYLNAAFRGNQEAEFTWFALGASLPLVSMDAERAARQIVAATKRGDAEVILSVPAAVLARVHGLFPGLTADALGLVNRLLPSAPAAGPTAPLRGKDVAARLHSGALDTATAWGRDAAERFNERPAPSGSVDGRPLGAFSPAFEPPAAGS